MTTLTEESDRGERIHLPKHSVCLGDVNKNFHIQWLTFLEKEEVLGKRVEECVPPPLSHPMREEDHCGEVRRHQNTESVDLLNSQQLKVLMRSWDSLDDQESKSWERRLCFPTKLASVIRNRVGEGGTSDTPTQNRTCLATIWEQKETDEWDPKSLKNSGWFPQEVEVKLNSSQVKLT